MKTLTMVDLFCGLKGASRAMAERGWNVTTVDINCDFRPYVLSDIRTMPACAIPERADLLWASPPCDEFSREFMPWSRTGVTPDLSCVLAVDRLVNETKPRFWACENVRGAAPYLNALWGKPAWIRYPVYLWGKLPPLPQLHFRGWKEHLSSSQPEKRAEIPYALSLALALAVESALPMEVADDLPGLANA